MKAYAQNYLESIQTIIDTLSTASLEKASEMLLESRKNNGRMFVIGNGGSAAITIHFAGDFSKNVTRDEIGRFNVISLCENITAITAYSNDIGYDVIFSEQLKNYNITNNDILIAVSSSGNSPNIVKACEYAKEKHTPIIGLSGFTGGKLKEMSDCPIYIECNEYEKVEDLHTMALHIIVSYFKKMEAKN